MKQFFNIKICGLKNKNNILEIKTLLPEYLGFIFYKKSPRYVGNNFVAPTLKKIQKVGVFVNECKKNILKKKNKNNLDLIQLHGQETINYCYNLKKENTNLIKVFNIDKNFNFNQIKDYENICSYFLFDTKTNVYGGSGKKFNWEKLSEYNLKTPFFLSGGITPKDIKSIHMISHPQFFGIDINSHFEIKPGIKNILTLKTFIKKIRL